MIMCVPRDYFCPESVPHFSVTNQIRRTHDATTLGTDIVGCDDAYLAYDCFLTRDKQEFRAKIIKLCKYDDYLMS